MRINYCRIRNIFGITGNIVLSASLIITIIFLLALLLVIMYNIFIVPFQNKYTIFQIVFGYILAILGIILLYFFSYTTTSFNEVKSKRKEIIEKLPENMIKEFFRDLNKFTSLKEEKFFLDTLLSNLKVEQEQEVIEDKKNILEESWKKRVLSICEKYK